MGFVDRRKNIKSLELFILIAKRLDAKGFSRFGILPPKLLIRDQFYFRLEK